MGQLRCPQRRWIRWLPFLFFLVATSSQGAPLIKLGRDFMEADLIEYSDLLIDDSRRLTIDQVTQTQIADNFAPASGAQIQQMDRSGSYWLRFGIDNPLTEAQIVALNLSVHHDVAVTVFSASLQPIPLQHEPMVQLLIPPQSKQLYYLRVGPGVIETPRLQLLSLERYVTTHRLRSWIGGVLQSCLILVSATAIFIGWLRRDSAYWWLAGYCTALTLFELFYGTGLPPFASRHILSWQYRQPFLQACLLLSVMCCIGIARHLPITRSPRLTPRHPLPLLSIGSALSIPVLFFVPPLTGVAIIVVLTMLTQLATASIALHNFLFSYRRELLLYALLRIFTLAITVGGAFAWYTQSSIRALIDDIAPIAMITESVGILGILLWCSFERQRAQALVAREIAVIEAEARSRMEVVAEVGHRVRTPISGVLGMLDMMQDTALSATQVDYVNTIRRASNELLNAIDEISDVSRLQAHASQLQQNIFDPQALVTECIDGFRSAATAHRLELINDIAPEIPAYVSGDSTRLRQILLQLLHQAVSQSQRGEIVCRVQQLQTNWLHFDIQTHAGIAVRPLRDGDRRADAAGSASVRLAIARQLTEMLGGQIRIDDWADGNLHAWFDLELPTVERNAPTTHRDTTLQDKRLLVIDDNATFCDVLERQLKHWGMVVYTAATASEGLARLRNQVTLSEPVDALLIDTDIPELHQSEWIQRVRNEIEPMPIVIFLSSAIDDTLHAATAESQRVLLKPVNHTSLKITLIEAFKQRAQSLLPASRPRNQPIRCLFAEDNAINAKVLAGMLDKLGVSYTAASNGQEAVDACRRDRFDIVLMDWDMPVMDGWEASRRIREMFESRGMPAMPIIALTANSVEELGERAREPVMDAHLVKPIQLQSLRELLEQWTGKLVAPTSDPAH